MNKKYVAIFVVILVVIVALISSNKNDQQRNLIASGHPSWAPIMYEQDDKIVGAGPEIISKVFGDLGIKVDALYEGSWDVVQQKARDGTVDVLVAAYKTAERETYMDYSIPYTIDPVVLVVKKGKAFTYNAWDDLISKKGVVTTGDSYGQEFDNFIKEKLNPVKVVTPDEAFALLNKGDVDYFVYALYSAQNFISQNKLTDQVEIIPKFLSSENFYLTISKKSPFVNRMPEINTLLKKYSDDGTIDQIIKKYSASTTSVSL